MAENPLLPPHKELEDWISYWRNGEIDFHLKEVNPILLKNYDRFLDGRQNLRILVPLCGKSVDLKYLSDLGHYVTGVEQVDIAVLQFFKEQKLSYSTTPLPNGGTLYVAQNGRLKIYQCDFFQLDSTIIGGFDAIWDRAAMVSLNEEDRQKYADLITSVLVTGGKVLLNTVEYDKTVFVGPPHSVSDKEIQIYFDSNCHIKYLHYEDGTTDYMRYHWNLDIVYLKVALLTKK